VSENVKRFTGRRVFRLSWTAGPDRLVDMAKERAGTRWLRAGAILGALLVAAAGHALYAGESGEARQLADEGRFAEAATLYGMSAEEARNTREVSAELRARLGRVQALEALGATSEARREGSRLLELVAASRDPEARALGRAAVGRLLIAGGDIEDARQQIEEARGIAAANDLHALLAAIENDLANLESSAGEREKARLHAEASVAEARRANRPDLEAVALANLARLVVEPLRRGEGSSQESLDRLEIELVMSRLRRATALVRGQAAPRTRPSLRLWLSIANTYTTLVPHAGHREPALESLARELLDQVREISLAAGDARAASYAYGFLARIELAEDNLGAALIDNSRALTQASKLDAPELTFRWLGQRGRLLAARGQKKEAILAYRQSIELAPGLTARASHGYQNDLSLRDDLAAAHRELVGLLLEESPTSAKDPRTSAEGSYTLAEGSHTSAEGSRTLADGSRTLAQGSAQRQAQLREARDVIERSRAAELRDYFRDDCVDRAREARSSVDLASASAAVVYPIILHDRLEILVTLPGGQLRRFHSRIDRKRLTQDTRELRRLLEKRTTQQYLRPAQRLHATIIGPIVDALESAGVDTLVVVPDGPLRTIPFAALHDGDRFLVERWAVAVTPGIELTDPAPLPRKGIRGLYAGLSESVDGMPALDYVPTELEQAREHIDGPVLLDRDFVISALGDSIESQSYRLIHIATHGDFAADPSQSFLLAYDGRLGMDDLGDQLLQYRYRQEPLDLLILSACETASGNDRSALGLAGMAVRAGARSVLGTLWLVNDAATASLLDSFYTHIDLRPADADGWAGGGQRASRALALQRAQLSLLESPDHRHPGYWAPFVLIGSWL
jgi:CHAT domain-containing protein